jgi:spermidine synthase
VNRKNFYLEIFLVSLAAILLEVNYTRVFSFKLFYYFTYLIIGIALLGLGAGAIFVAVFPRLRRMSPERLIPLCCLVAGAWVPCGYLLVATTQLNAVDLGLGIAEMLKLGLICTAVFIPFLMTGIVIATIFGARPAEINRLYFADLLGAGLGCAFCVPLLDRIGPPGGVVLGGLILALSGMRLAAGTQRLVFSLSALVAALLVVPVSFPGLLPDPVPDRIKTMSPQRRGDGRILFSQWSSVFRLDVIDGPDPESRYLLNHDGMIGATVLRFDGDMSSMGELEGDLRSYPFRVLEPEPEVLIIGAAGGREILTSLYFGADHVTGVELNPVTISLLTDHFADYSGRIAENDRVTLIKAEGRSFVKRDREKYDLIWFVAPDSYSAMNAATSGAFVLSESYLYTSEMIQESLGHLTDDGVICVQFAEISFDLKPNRTSRYLGTAREAFRRLGVEDFDRHVLMSATPEFFTMATILLKRTPFSPAEILRFRAASEAVEGSVVWHAGGQPVDVDEGHPVRKVVSLPRNALSQWYASYPYDIRPVDDDAPFFWHFVRYRDTLEGEWGGKEFVWDPEDATGERVVISLLAFAIAFAAVFLILPLVMVREVWGLIPYKTSAAIYFAALGLGFMFFEISLIQRLTLFLGYPTYSLTVTLFALLVFSGIGSLVSDRYSAQRNRALLFLLVALAALILWYQFGMGWVVDRYVGVPLPIRVSLAILFLAPLGLCLGAFMPIGLASISAVTEYKREFIAWGWAVNGFFSVVSSILATVLSMTTGFKMVMLIAGVVYLVGIAALTRIPPPLRSAAAPGGAPGS